MRVWGSEIVFAVLLCGTLSSTAQPHHNHRRFSQTTTTATVCPVHSLLDFVLGFPDSTCPLPDSLGSIAVTEKALNMVHKNNHEYVAVLFYASWCPFSRVFRPVFSVLSALHPSIPHFSIEESSVRPRFVILSKYGVHGFPTLFILNSTMRVRYHGSRTLASLIGFYNDVTGIRIDSLDQLSLEKIGRSSTDKSHGNTEPESCPFSWARSPENLLRQETYLALATTFVVLRLLYSFFPTLLICIQFAWRRVIQNIRLGSLLEHPLIYLKRLIQSFNCLKEPCKRSNLQEGAMNARAWASKSLATVSIGEESSSRGMHQ
ncbi:5'-adenylylsulfate reductase-like 4 isoform X3 [Vigna radiata var. radiata]|uniref:5'-adenylylsulfate reductase-like 4 isoform X3 n=1 Tax=Vigna radiata var. radiata TaxID=3916 RepID=A0A3Q0EXC0_VIGRR|nr:5'-adenylylsulfate reductase-like 4 isoform X3 [Vigna radiata var. radiata]